MDDLTEHEGIQDGDKWDIHQQEPLWINIREEAKVLGCMQQDLADIWNHEILKT